MKLPTVKTAAYLSAITAAVFVCMLLVSHFGGITQQYFEFFHTPEKYAGEITEHSSTLNTILAIDNIFIVLYTCTALYVVTVLKNNAPSVISILAYVFAIAVGLLDFAENFHIYSLMQTAQSGAAVTLHDVQWQVQESMLKWHIAYTEFFFIGFMLTTTNTIEKMLKYSMWFWFLPTGVLVYSFRGTHTGALLELVRYLNLLAGFVGLFIILKNRKVTDAAE